MFNAIRRIAICVLVFYLGVILLGLFSYKTYQSLFQKPIEAVFIAANHFSKASLPYDPWFFHEETDSRKKGVTVSKPQQMWGQHTLFSKADSHEVLVLNAAGEKVKSWDADFRKIWPNPTHVEMSFGDKHITLGRVFYSLENNGSIYVMFFGPDFMYEYGLAKLDKEGNVLWTLDDHAHHDVTQLNNGKLLTFLGVLKNEEDKRLPKVTPPFIDEYLLVLNADGTEDKRISISDAFLNSDFASSLKDMVSQPADVNMRVGDLLHPNTITLIPDHLIGTQPWFRANSVLLSFRNTDMLAILDLEAGVIRHAFLGPWRGQHSPRFTVESRVVMFDNQGDIGASGTSRIIEVDLNTLEITWEYGGTKETPFQSTYNGMVEPLPNGNFLVTETDSGRIFEITRQKEIVWEYYSPERYEFKGAERIPSVFSAHRLPLNVSF